MKAKLVFDTWIDPLNVQLSDEQRDAVANDLSLSNLHSGTIFNSEIDLNDEDKSFIKEGMRLGLKPSFYVILDENI